MNNHSWSPYVGSGSIILAVVLLIVTAVLMYFAFRLQHPKEVKRPGTFLGVVIVVLWLLSVTTLLVAESIYVLALYQQRGPITVPKDYIFPVTMTCALVSFFVIAYLARRSGFWGAVVSAIVGTITAPLIFELPFDLIVMWRSHPPTPGTLFTLLAFLPLFLIEISSFALLAFSPAIKLSRATLFLLAGMFFVFAVWAAFGFAYPATAFPIAMNVISKILAFATAVSLFLPLEKATEPVKDVEHATASHA
jgi:hypothetical protein